MTPKRNLSEMPLKQSQYKQSQYWDSPQSRNQDSPQQRQLPISRLQEEPQASKDEDVIEILDEDNEGGDPAIEVPERPKRKKVVQVKVEDESEVSALKTLGFRVCS